MERTYHQIRQHKEKLAAHLRKHPAKWERDVWAILKPLGFSHRGILPQSLIIAQFVDYHRNIVIEVNSPTHDYLQHEDRLDTIRRSGYKLLLFRRDQNLQKVIPEKLKETERLDGYCLSHLGHGGENSIGAERRSRKHLFNGA